MAPLKMGAQQTDDKRMAWKQASTTLSGQDGRCIRCIQEEQDYHPGVGGGCQVTLCCG